MPNHCDQQVYIQGPKRLIHQIYESVWVTAPEERQFCQLIKPMPFEQWLAPKTKWGGYEVEGWYDWRVNNWGTKWDVVDVQLTNELEDNEDRSWFSFNCWTAWGAPIPVWDKLHELGVEVHATYQDEGGMFEGDYYHGVDRSWGPEVEEECANA